MLELLRRFKFGIAAVAFVFAPAAWYVTPAFDARPACQRGGDWIARNAAQLPQTLDEFAAFPSGMRRVVFSALSADAKAAMWQEQLRRFVRSRTLSIEQQQLVNRAARLYIPESYVEAADGPSASMQALLDGIVQDAKRLFGTTDRRAFYVLGESATPVHSFETMRLAVTDAIRNYGSASAAQLPECNCQLEDDCPGGYNCGGVNPCSETWGCGPGGILKCHFLCIPN